MWCGFICQTDEKTNPPSLSALPPHSLCALSALCPSSPCPTHLEGRLDPHVHHVGGGAGEGGVGREGLPVALLHLQAGHALSRVMYSTVLYVVLCVKGGEFCCLFGCALRCCVVCCVFFGGWMSGCILYYLDVVCWKWGRKLFVCLVWGVRVVDGGIIHMYICIYRHTPICIYIQTQTHTYIYICRHITSYAPAGRSGRR